MRTLGAQGSALRCAVESCSAPAMSACRYTPGRCEARRCIGGRTDGSGEKRTGCLCIGSADESRWDEGWPLDLEARSSDWGPGSRAERLGVVRRWHEAVSGGRCALPDGWGTDRLPVHMEQVVRSWEAEEGHGRYVDRRRGVLMSTGTQRHAHGRLVRVGTGGSSSGDGGDTRRAEVPRGTDGGEP